MKKKIIILTISGLFICQSFLNWYNLIDNNEAQNQKIENNMLDINMFVIPTFTPTPIPTLTPTSTPKPTITPTPIVNDIKSYTDEELHILSHVIYGEAGGYSRELQIGVGSVVLNRVKHERYPNTIKDVVFQSGQYACTWDGNYDREPDQQAIDVAIYLLENGSQFPEYVLYQSEFLQGDRVYRKIGNTYFCYYRKDVK